MIGKIIASLTAGNGEVSEPVPFPIDVMPPQFKADEKISVEHTKKVLQKYWDFPIDKASKALESNDSNFWIQKGQERALELFHAAAERVPAYKDFLKKRSINHEKIKTIDDFRNVPPVEKDNYLRAYPLHSILWDGQLSNSNTISVSSGSSGKVFFWPRGMLLDIETTYLQESYLSSFFKIDRRSTLYLDCFAMGMYIAGPIIFSSALRIAQKGYPLTVMTPGLSMEDILKILPEVAPQFEQVILAGYPPYIKDIIEEAINAGVDWSKLNVKMVLAGEGFSETWRDYVADLVGGINVHDSFINLYGTADASVLAHETPESITIRRFASQHKDLRADLFHGRHISRLPTLVQYHPTQKYFEEVEEELHFTANSCLPLIRYNIGDDGGIISYDEASRICAQKGLNTGEALSVNAPGAPSWKLPFVYLYGRSDFTVVFYGANVYPENVKEGLNKQELRQFVTGRFVMLIERYSNQNPYLLLHIELAEGIRATAALEKKIRTIVTETLVEQNDEFRSSYHAKGAEKATPVIVLHPKGEEPHFARKNNKQRWTEKKNSEQN